MEMQLRHSGLNSVGTLNLSVICPCLVSYHRVLLVLTSVLFLLQIPKMISKMGSLSDDIASTGISTVGIDTAG